MFKFLKIGVGFKITALVFVVVLISVVSVGYIAFFLSRSSLETRYQESIDVVARLKTQKIEAFFDKIRANIQFGSQLESVRQKCVSAQAVDTVSTRRNRKQDSLAMNTKSRELRDLLQNVLNSYEIRNIYITNPGGEILYSQGESPTPQGRVFTEKDANTLSSGRDSVYFGNAFRNGMEHFMHVSAPVRDGKKNLLGVIVYEAKLKYVFGLVKDTSGLGRTGEIILARQFDNQILYLNPTRLSNFDEKTKVVYPNPYKERSIQSAVRGSASPSVYTGFYDIDYRNREVLTTWQYISLVGWGVIVKIDKEEIYEPTIGLRNNLIITGLTVFLISLLIGVIFSRSSLVRPLMTLKETINLLAKGVLPDKFYQSPKTQDEIGEMAGKLNELVSNLKTKANFALSIGQGDLKADFKPASQQDNLGLALLNMRNSIQNSDEKDREQSWIVEGIAEIGDKLPSIATIDELGDLVCQFLTNKIGAVQGAFYTMEQEHQTEDEKRRKVPVTQYLELNASFAFNKKKYLESKFKLAEGLVGQCAVEKDIIIRTEIPNDYFTISSGILGDRKPKCILIAPLITNEIVYGVLELAGFTKFGQREIAFIKQVSEIIARTVFNIKVRENTERLLEESQELSANLQKQQVILEQNAKDMEMAQDNLERTNEALENQIKEVERANDRTRLLLENASEVITIYEENATIRYISPSVSKILGYSQDEMIGIKDVMYIHEKGVLDFEQMFTDLLKDPTEKITIQFSYQTKTNESIWLEATGTNLLSDPAIQGIVVNSRDITERREVEREQRLRGQMQALSENSPDLITRISKEGQIFYINPTIQEYTARDKDEFLQKSISDSDVEQALNKNIILAWKNIVEEVIDKKHNVNTEMDFHCAIGERIMQVSAIPEYNEQHNIESVLMVSHDITERKAIEVEITRKNKNITESINYAKRIQEAILPDNNLIKGVLPKSFMLYKPRDVVSGDFPWFIHFDDVTYIAAVDCTGHGVPGALMSLIGFFLLNNIVNLKQANTPGTILDLLDEEVTRTLKQDESESSTKDGMDISLCKINHTKNQMEYAGAHRPLYYLRQGELYEIKGNKFPIGGAQYKNRARFTNTIINYKPNDSVYIFSDGFPDQFGGPKQKKFSPNKIREIIKGYAPQGLPTLKDMLNSEFEAWKDTNKQTDDVLMIGIQF